MIYLDNAATTKPDEEVLAAMMPYLTNEWANPGASYSFGKCAAHAVEAAREQVARFIGADPSQIIFTSGGTEANNLAVFGTNNYMISKGQTHIVTDKTEHISVLKPIENLCIKHQFHVDYLPVNEDGTVNYNPLKGILSEQTGLVSVMYVNNETGAENDVKEIAATCRDKGVLFHTDCVQAAGGFKIDVREIGCDMLSLSAHKIHGVKGAGALYVRDRSILTPLISGGSFQEGGLRGGTQNVPAIVAFGKACELAKKSQHDLDVYTSTLRQVFYTALIDELETKGLSDIVHINGQSIVHRGKILNVRFDGVDSETILIALASRGVYVSSGAACHSGEQKPSEGLVEMGLTPEQARDSIRISFSKDNNGEQVERAAKVLASCIYLLHKGFGLLP